MDWQGFQSEFVDGQVYCGTEHLVELSAVQGRVGKMTIPPAFGLIPRLIWHPVINLRDDPSIPPLRPSIEFFPATPLEYFERWIAANDVFGDDVMLTSVVRWRDGQVSVCISQPQYHGTPATEREIEHSFREAGWTHVRDKSGAGHSLHYNYAFQVLAIDALPRNCRMRQGQFLPFDVILCHPDPELESFLELYPGLPLSGA